MARICMLVFNRYATDPRVRRQAEALVNRGDVVDCICLPSAEAGQGWLDGVRLFFASTKKYAGANLVSHMTASVRFFCYAFLKLSILHLRQPYDIVQIHTMPDFLVFAALVPKLLGAKVILDVHDLAPEVYMAKFNTDYRTLVVRLLIWIERFSVAFADKAIAVHAPHLDILVKHGNPRSKFSVVLNTPDDRIFGMHAARGRTSDALPRPFRVIYHGSIPRRSGLHVALRAIARCRNKIPDIEFQIVGDGEDVPRLAQLTRALDLSDCVHFKKAVPVERLPPILKEASVGVIPYTANAFTHHVLPTKLLEYAALQIPVIVSRLHAIETYFDDNMVGYFEAGDDAQLAQQILWLYRHPDAAGRLAANAARFVEAHDWKREKDIYFGLVDSLLSVPRERSAMCQH
jgi:glycosyltransferase involved in cell wall biosynthesis